MFIWNGFKPPVQNLTRAGRSVFAPGEMLKARQVHRLSLTGDVVEGATKNREIRNPVFTVAQQSTDGKTLGVYDLFDIHENIDRLVTNILILWLKIRVVRWLAKVTLRWKGQELEALLCLVLSGTHCSKQVHKWPCLKLPHP